MAHHIWVHPERLKKAEKMMKVDRMTLNVELSPYAMPKRIVGNYDEKKGRFVIQFDYIDDEPPNPVPSKYKSVEVLEGKFSGKLLQIAIKVDTPPLNKIAVIGLKTQVMEALKRKHEGGATLNTEVAEELLGEEETFNTLASELVAN
jgi:hypothetical protein